MPSGLAQVPYRFDFNADCRKAYEEIISLRLVSGKQILDSEKIADPGNLITYFLENYIDFFTLYFNEDPAQYQQRKPQVDQRLAMMKKGDPSSPFYLFTRSVIYFQWAAVDIKFGDHWDAAWYFRRSFLAGKENLEKFPDFQPGLMLQDHAGSCYNPPDTNGNKLLGIQGTIDAGMNHLEES
jgi:hypothetical protein